MQMPNSLHPMIVRTAIKLVALLFFLLLWQVLVQANVMKPLMFGNIPSPIEILKTLSSVLVKKIFYYHVTASLLRVGAGSLLALIVAVHFGLLIGLSKRAHDLFFPLFEILRPIPQIAWIPVAILLFPTIEGSIIFITFIGAFYPILVNTIAGVTRVEPNLITAAESMGATKQQMLRLVYFPAALPSIFTGFTIGIGVSWISVVAAEMIAGKYGIGYYTWTSYTIMSYSETIIGMFTIGLLGSLCFAALKQLERFCLGWREEKG